MFNGTITLPIRFWAMQAYGQWAICSRLSMWYLSRSVRCASGNLSALGFVHNLEQIVRYKLTSRSKMTRIRPSSIIQFPVVAFVVMVLFTKNVVFSTFSSVVYSLYRRVTMKKPLHLNVIISAAGDDSLSEEMQAVLSPIPCYSYMLVHLMLFSRCFSPFRFVILFKRIVIQWYLLCCLDCLLSGTSCCAVTSLTSPCPTLCPTFFTKIAKTLTLNWSSWTGWYFHYQ
jgi:hypothetical protein